MNHMLWVGENVVTLDKYRTPEEVAALVEKVTADDLRRVAQGLFKTSALNLALVGPEPSEKTFRERLFFS